MKSSNDSTATLSPMQDSLRRAPRFFGLLLAFTALLLLWQHCGMDRVIEVSARSPFPYVIGTDRESGGASTATVKRVGDALALDCQLVKQAAWPYCKIHFDLGSVPHGLDLSQFQSVTLDADYVGPGEHRARLVLVNFDRGFSKVDNWLTHKVNEVEAFEIKPGESIEVPLDVFFTAKWWKEQARPPIAHTGARVDNVIAVELVTSGETTLGHHVLTLRAFRFHGKWITNSQLLVLLITLWIGAAIGWQAMLALALRRELNTNLAELRLLNEVNRALKLETEHLAGQAHHDPLTGVLNREGLRAELMATSSLLSDPMSIIFLDIDHFKRINDGHGHDVGDLVLRHFAVTIASIVRGSDRLVRWGGEEFLLVCPMSDVHQAAALAEKLRLALMAATWPKGLAVTASFGVAQHDVNEEIGDVVKRADHELYQAKQSGRNRVHADTGRAAPAPAPAIPMAVR